MSRLLAVVPLLAILVAGCSDTSTTSPSVTLPTKTETFVSVLGFDGSTSRAFAVSTGGTLTVTLTSVGPPSLAVGLGIGISGAGPSCSLSTAVVASPSSAPQISVTVDPGVYCVQVYDLGTVNDHVNFVVSIEHP